MSAAFSTILDIDGRPFPRAQVKKALDQLLANRRPGINGSYDAAGSSDEFRNHWASADSYDADSAHSRSVRSTLVSRSRYETGNNGYADGIAQTYATDVVGVGPALRMLTGSNGFNQLVEREFAFWAKAVLLRRKLWCMAHAKHQDGETFAVLRTNRGIKHALPLDVVLYETEQCQSPMIGIEQGHIDGILFDEFGNPTYYEILRSHPGSNYQFGSYSLPERIQAKYVMHWFKLRRPGQHRAVPESTSTLHVGAGARRWREATIGAAESAAEFTTLLKTTLLPDEVDSVSPMSTLDIQKRMMTALPMGYDVHQMKAEHPNATFESFHKATINEQARCKNMPYNKAACDSSSYNYASGRLDHQTYYGSLDVDRADADDLVLDPLFDIWFDEAIRTYGWFGGDPSIVTQQAKAHSWDWPKHRVADVQAEADANDTNLRNGSIAPSKLASDAGEDFEDKVDQMAKDFGVTPAEMRQVLLHELYPQGAKAVFMPTALGGMPNEQPNGVADDADQTQTN